MLIRDGSPGHTPFPFRSDFRAESVEVDQDHRKRGARPRPYRSAVAPEDASCMRLLDEARCSSAILDGKHRPGPGVGGPTQACDRIAFGPGRLGLSCRGH